MERCIKPKEAEVVLSYRLKQIKVQKISSESRSSIKVYAETDCLKRELETMECPPAFAEVHFN